MAERADASIAEIAAFSAVAQSGSFTRAAENLGTSKSNVGKAVQRLEERLGTRLFQRTTRAVRLTEDGETYLQAAQAALDGLREAEQALAARKQEPIGRVRVDMPSGFGRMLLPALAELRQLLPKVTLELALTDRMSDPVAEGWDIVVRIGELAPDSGMTVRKLCDLKLALYASPGYLARRDNILRLSDLTNQDGVVFRGPSGQLRPWTVNDGGATREVTPTAVLITADGQTFIDAALNGFGVAQILDWVAQPYITAGRLVHILPEVDVQGPPVHALIPLGQRMPAKTRAVLNHIVQSLKRMAP